ncbi:MAG: hypothetical protein AAGN35_00335 [Bacteroidota bacterium]
MPLNIRFTPNSISLQCGVASRIALEGRGNGQLEVTLSLPASAGCTLNGQRQTMVPVTSDGGTWEAEIAVTPACTSPGHHTGRITAIVRNSAGEVKRTWKPIEINC